MQLFYLLAGLVLLVVAAFLGLYVGVYVLLYGTVVDFIADPGFLHFIWACIKWTFAGVGGWAVAAFIGTPAIGLITRGLR